MKPITARRASLEKSPFRARLGDIATIRQGYHFRKKIEHNPDGDICVVQSGDITANRVASEGLVRVSGERIKPEYHLQPRSLLLKARGTNYTAALFDIEGIKAVAAYHFLVVAIQNHELLPKYLTWFVNRPQSQYFLSQVASGSYIKALSPQALATFEVTIPSIEQQELIVNIDHLAQRESVILDEIKAKRNQMIQSILNRSISGRIRTQP